MMLGVCWRHKSGDVNLCFWSTAAKLCPRPDLGLFLSDSCPIIVLSCHSVRQSLFALVEFWNFVQICSVKVVTCIFSAVKWICQIDKWKYLSCYIDLSKLIHGLLYIVLSELFSVFLALCQTKPCHKVWKNESEPGSWLDSLFHKRHATIVLTVDTYFCTIKTLHWVWNK